MKINEILNELYSIDSPKFKLGLTRTKTLLRKLNNPQSGLKYIHVAGTNGKGSVCAMLHSILVQAGYKVGMYTSPHLKKFNERIRVNHKLITDKEIVNLYLKTKKHITNQSFFEITTVMALQYFYEKKVDIVILEVGLGGRLDSTNVITPIVSVITNIGLEHTEFLGDTIEKIAFEKAAIIKPSIPVVTTTNGIALEKIKKTAKEKKSKLVAVNQNEINKRTYKDFSWHFDYKDVKNISLGLNGTFQLVNALTVLKTISLLNDFKISNKNIKSGLKKARWPGRFEIKKGIIYDCCHNYDGFKTLFNELKHFKYKRLILLTGFSKNKDVQKISKLINQNADWVILTQAKTDRAAAIDEIKPYFQKSLIIKDTSKALQKAKKLKEKDDLLVVAGSIYLVGELLW